MTKSMIRSVVEKLPHAKKTFVSVVIILMVVLGVHVAPKYIARIAILCTIWAIAASGWNICYGYAGLLSFGHIAFFGIGAYLTTWFFKFYSITPWLGILVAATLTVPFGFFVARITAKTRGVYFALATAVIPSILTYLFIWPWTWTVTGGTYGISFPYHYGNPLYMDFLSYTPYFLVGLVTLLLVLLGIKKMTESTLGQHLRAIGQDEIAAETLGINSFKTRVIGVSISAFITALSGGLFVTFLKFIDPYLAFGWTPNLQIIIMAVLGGVGTIMGPVFGAFILIPLYELVKRFLGGGFVGMYLVFYGVILMFIIFFLPQGIYGKIKESLRGSKRYEIT